MIWLHAISAEFSLAIKYCLSGLVFIASVKKMVPLFPMQVFIGLASISSVTKHPLVRIQLPDGRQQCLEVGVGRDTQIIRSIL